MRIRPNDPLLSMIRARTLPGDFTLSSGEKSDIYCDVRLVSHTWTGFLWIGEQIVSMTRDLDYNAVGGTAIGAIPVALAVSHAKRIDAFTVRAKRKDHGTHRLIEGMDVSGRRVLIVDDVITTGASVLHAVKAALAAGATVAGIAVVLNRMIQSAPIRWADESKPVFPFRYLYTLEDLRNA